MIKKILFLHLWLYLQQNDGSVIRRGKFPSLKLTAFGNAFENEANTPNFAKQTFLKVGENVEKAECRKSQIEIIIHMRQNIFVARRTAYKPNTDPIIFFVCL